MSDKPMTRREQQAWRLYCDETAGSMDVRDYWHELSPKIQEMFLAKVAPLRLLTKAEAVSFGYKVDTSTYPHYAYKGPRFQPKDNRLVMTDLEESLLCALRAISAPAAVAAQLIYEADREGY